MENHGFLIRENLRRLTLADGAPPPAARAVTTAADASVAESVAQLRALAARERAAAASDPGAFLPPLA